MSVLSFLMLEGNFLCSIESPCYPCYSQYPQFQYKDAGFRTQAHSMCCSCCWPGPRTHAPASAKLQNQDLAYAFSAPGLLLSVQHRKVERLLPAASSMDHFWERVKWPSLSCTPLPLRPEL